MRDLQQRLIRCGEQAPLDSPGVFGPATSAAVRSFQARQGLHVDGICGVQTWAMLVEASYQLGDRPLYRRSPMMRGDDVATLQAQLGALGFDAGRVDGIFGPDTAGALADFQLDSGLTPDGVFGPEVLATLRRLGDRTSTVSKAGIRERLELLGRPRHLKDRRVLVAEPGAVPALANALARALSEAGANTLVVHHPDGSMQAAEANHFDAEVFIAIDLVDSHNSRVAYYGSARFESPGGLQLARLASQHLGRIGLPAPASVAPMRLPALRETRMPAVLCEIGPPSWAVEHSTDCSSALAAAVVQWTAEPVARP